MTTHARLCLLLAALFAVMCSPSAAVAAEKATHVPGLTGHWAIGSDYAVVTPSRDDPFGAGRRQIALQLWFPLARARGPAMPYLPAGVAAVVARGEGIRADALRGVRTNARESRPGLAAAASFPIVLFSPGYGEPHGVYTALLEDLASHGFVVIALDHTHESAAVELPAGTVVQSIVFDPRNERLKQRVADARDDDVADVLAALPRLRRTGQLPTSANVRRIGIFGHSLGGRTAVSTLARQADLRCAADVDGSLLQLPSTLDVRKPVLVLTGVEGSGYIRGFWPSVRGERWWFDVRGAQHLAFSDWLWLAPALARTGKAPASGADAGGIAPQRGVAIARTYLASFFRACLAGGSKALLERPRPPYAGITRRR